ncbi:MAG: DNA integrity scanning protein DisA nucleotide-binding domain protein [Thermoguttaceae bacterium]|nr:DNA integrity scanning protein DisA nucleotide-binding domain protein [Thermoguttaceae bacterium]MDO4424469.1 DNA integrity scanning protein DisA nucleotide-binding domain protein [Planctomycetia bacterium]
MSNPLRITEQFRYFIEHAKTLQAQMDASAIILLYDGTADWGRVKKLVGENVPFILAVDTEEQAQGAAEAGINTIVLEMVGNPVYDRLMQALLEAITDDLIRPGSQIVAIYGGFESNTIDTVSLISLKEHLNRLTSTDLRLLNTTVPLETLKTIVELAVEIGLSGREGKPVGTLFVVGDKQRVLAESHAGGFDPVRGYSRSERNIMDARVREGIKEIAQLDGAIIISADGIVEASCRILDASADNITLSKGLGSRHWAAAGITRCTKAVAIVVSETNGTVRIFQNGEVMLRIEPTNRKPFIWKKLEYEPPEN